MSITYLFFSLLYKCFSNGNLRHHKNQRWHKQGTETVILNCRFNVKCRYILNTFNFLLLHCYSLSIFKSSDQQSWTYSKTKSDSPLASPATFHQSIAWVAYRKEPITGTSLSSLPFSNHGYAELYPLAVLYINNCATIKIKKQIAVKLKTCLYGKIYFQMRKLSWEKSTIFNKMCLDEDVCDGCWQYLHICWLTVNKASKYFVWVLSQHFRDCKNVRFW